jgi:glycosyltransferase involved in cell wall biosynthesis
MGITKNQITNDFNKLKKIAQNLFEEDDLESCLDIIVTASRIAYHLNFCLQDQKLEDLLSKISQKISCGTKKENLKDRFVFYDYFGWDNRGLTQQYIRALISWDCEFLFVFENTPTENMSSKILSELKNYPKAKILCIDNKLSKIEKIKFLSDAINDYQPQKAFLHLAPWDVIGICVWNILSHIQRYQINLTDHAFWLGTNCIDYCIEFRDYGYNLSKKHRNISEDKLLIQPYYPIIDDQIPFQGFPVETKGKITIISGSSYYKVFGGNELFFKLLANIVKQHPDVVILFAGDGDRKLFKSLLDKYKISDKVFLLGNRKDITQVISHGDIYLSTYPLGGGLMSQYAAMLEVPIIAYVDTSTSESTIETLFLNDDIKVSYDSMESFLEELSLLINDEQHRKKRAYILKKAVIQPDEFNQSLRELVNTNTEKNVVKEININTDLFFKLYLDTENRFLHQYNSIMMQSKNIYKKAIVVQFCEILF